MPNELNARTREGKGKEFAKKMRAAGKIPAVLYGHGFDPLMLELDAREVASKMRAEGGLHGLMDLKVLDGKEKDHLVMVKGVQRHPTKPLVIHIDLQKIKRGEQVQTEVPLHFTGEAKGAKMGGVMQHHLYEVKVGCESTDLPERIVVDITELDVGENIRVSDLPVLPGVEYITPADDLVVTIVAKRGLTAAEEEAEAEAEAAKEAAREGAAAAAAEAEE